MPSCAGSGSGLTVVPHEQPLCEALFGHSKPYLLGWHIGLDSSWAKFLSLTVAMFSTAWCWRQRERETDNSLQTVGLPG